MTHGRGTGTAPFSRLSRAPRLSQAPFSGRLPLLTVLFVSSVVLAGCSPLVVHLPDHLQSSPVVEDVRRELRFYPWVARVAPAGALPGGPRDVLLFAGEPAAEHGAEPSREGDDGGESPVRVLHSRGNRRDVLEEVFQWLDEAGATVVLLVVQTGDDRHRGEPREAADASPHRFLVEISAGRSAEQNIATLRGAVHRHGGADAIILLAGDPGTALLQEMGEGFAEGPVVIAELMLAAHGRAVRNAGVPLDGVIAMDLVESLRRIRNAPKEQRFHSIYTRFFRY